MLTMSLPIAALSTHEYVFLAIPAHAAWRFRFRATKLLIGFACVNKAQLANICYHTYALSKKLVIHITDHRKN